MNMIAIELINLLVSFMILGFILLVSLTHYPSFKYIDKNHWKDFHSHHSRTISIIIIPLMLIELAFALFLVWKSPSSAIWLISLALVIGVWLNTFLQAVPMHMKLGEAKDLKLITKLNNVNWIRTILWSIKAILLFWAFTL